MVCRTYLRSTFMGCGIFALLAAVATLILAEFAAAEPPDAWRSDTSPPNQAGFRQHIAEVPPRERRSEDEIRSFIDKLSTNDAIVEVVVGQGRLVTLKEDLAAPGMPEPIVAAGDPTVVDFEIIGLRHIRLTGRRIGVTDLSVVTPDRREFTFEVHVVADLEILRARLAQLYPDASLRLAQLRDHVIVEGQARDSRQVASIIETIKAYMQSVYTAQLTKIESQSPAYPLGFGAPGAPAPTAQPPRQTPGDDSEQPDADATPEESKPEFEAKIAPPQIINLIKVPGPQQVLLKVQVAELNRTALRRLGFSRVHIDDGDIVGSNISGFLSGASVLNPLGGLLLDDQSTVFGVLDNGEFSFFIDALRQNEVLKILAEPNLVAMNGEEATFLAGGEFPVPVPQSGAFTGAVTIIYKEFGVRLEFIPFIQDDEVVRLAVAPEVSTPDFTLGIETAGVSVPALNVRNTSTVVEMRQGQTLAISGLLQVTLEGRTSRVPGLGDLDYIGPLFSNNTSETVEKELVILVTPYLVEALDPDQVPQRPGDLVCDPDDLEFYLLGRIEGRTGCCDYRATDGWFNALHRDHVRSMEKKYLFGPYGYCE